MRLAVFMLLIACTFTPRYAAAARLPPFHWTQSDTVYVFMSTGYYIQNVSSKYIFRGVKPGHGFNTKGA